MIVELTDERRDTLYRDGLVLLPGVVPAQRVNAALRAVNASLGDHGLDPLGSVQSHCPELRQDPVITGLLTDTPLRRIAESAIGPGYVEPVTSGQIALRFPKPGPASSASPHLDGMHGEKNGVPAGVILNFTALVGVFLQDVPAPDSGNFTIWPGSHRTYEEHFRVHGPQSLLDGMPSVDVGAGRQITARAGDAVLCHYQLGHGISGNASPNIRYAIFFRLYRRDHESVHWECMTDIWREWDGMQDHLPDQAGRT